MKGCQLPLLLFLSLLQGGRGETDPCVCLPQPAQTTVTLGDSVRPPCLVLNGSSLVTITCSVYNSTNKVGLSFGVSDCSINFIAERVGPVELTCDVNCTHEVTTFNISWTVVGSVSPSMTRSPLATAGRVWPGPSATPATSCAPSCGDGPHPGGTSGAEQLAIVSDSKGPEVASSTPVCAPPCDDELHPGGGNGAGWKVAIGITIGGVCILSLLIVLVVIRQLRKKNVKEVQNHNHEREGHTELTIQTVNQ